MAMFRCKQPFAFDVDGVSRIVRTDDVVSSDEPAFQARPDVLANLDLFEPAEDYLGRRAGAGVEQATAAPGERRTLTRPTEPRATGGGKAPSGRTKAASPKGGTDDKKEEQS